MKLTKKLIDKVNKRFEQLGINNPNWKDYWDDTLTEEENLANIVSGKLESSFGDKDEVQHYDQVMAEQERQVIQQEIKKEFKEILGKETDDLKKYYFTLEKYIETTLKAKYLHSLFITGKAGIGKSFTVVKVLSNTVPDYKIVLGNISPLELFHTLYDYRKSVTVFDDTSGLLANKQSMSILMSAMWSPTNRRTVSWLTTSKKLKCPPQYEFQGKIIFIANEIPDNIKPIVSRCLEFSLNFNHFEILKIMAEISKLPHPTLSREERQMIFNWIKDNTDETTQNFDLRLQKKIETLYEYNKENWKELALKLVGRDEDLVVIKQLVKEYSTVKTQIQKWTEITGKSRRLFFYKKKLIEESSYKFSAKVQ
jgi:hypothetical protein